MPRKHHRGVLEGHAHCVFTIDSKVGYGNIRTGLCSCIRVIIHLSFSLRFDRGSFHVFDLKLLWEFDQFAYELSIDYKLQYVPQSCLRI